MPTRLALLLAFVFLSPAGAEDQPRRGDVEKPCADARLAGRDALPKAGAL